jgi:hypothetical protein
MHVQREGFSGFLRAALAVDTAAAVALRVAVRHIFVDEYTLCPFTTEASGHLHARARKAVPTPDDCNGAPLEMRTE